ncbi:MAG: ABC transporter substrate-binding protein [Rhodospirillales bacterium]|nr:ABC transporter substrate-binding protein [Rhodospirillales bacterium]
MLKKILLAGAALAFGAHMAAAKELKSIGISLGSMGNPFFVALSKGAEFEAKKVNPNVKITTVGYDYDLGKQNTEIDNFIAAGVDLILLNPGDPNAIEPAIKRAQKAGIIVVSVDTHAKGANATVETNNVQAGTIACDYLIQKMGGQGDMIIVNGPQVSSVIERVQGCKAVIAKHSKIRLLSFDQDAKGSRDGGLAVMQSLLTRFQKVDGVFAINDPTAIGAELAAKQLHRTNFPITAVDGAPDAETALKDPNSQQFVASASQDPFLMARLAVQQGVKLLEGKKLEKEVLLMNSKLVTRDNVGDYHGWSSH